MKVPGALTSILLFVAVGGCDKPSSPDTEACDGCRIRIEELLTIGEAAGAGALPEMPQRVRQDNSGRYWVLSAASPPLVFNSNGRFVALAGGQGDGPGEFRGAFDMLPVADSVVLFDGRYPRATVMGSDLQFGRMTLLPVGTEAASLISWPDRVAIKARQRSAAGWNLAIVDMSAANSTVVAEFGTVRILSVTQYERDVPAVVAPASGGRIWSADVWTFRIRRWTTSGTADWSLDRDLFPESPYSPSRDAVPTGFITGIAEGDDLLWVYYTVPREDWRGAWTDYPGGGGLTGETDTPQFPGNDELYDTMVEVMSITTKSVLAHTRLTGLVAPMSHNTAYRATEGIDGNPVVRVIRVRFDATAKRAASRDSI